MIRSKIVNIIHTGVSALTVMIFLLYGCHEEPSPPLSPDQALDSFALADDALKIELVASEPLVQDPVAMAFDEGGRLWVVEMMGFMPDIDGTGEEEKVGRISVLFDDNEDGQMDRSKVFLDSLVLPRAIAVVDGGILISENIPLWYAQDVDGDFKADKKKLIDAEYGGLGLPEHSANGLWRGMDNWYYSAKSKYRYRKLKGAWVKEETEFRGQWGICHDDAGRLFYNYNWSQLHADLVPPGALLQNKNHTPSSGIDHGLTLERKIFPIRSNTAINRGYVPGTLDGQGRLLEFASACGPLINRGDALPQSYTGDAFVCEPTANLIKRNKVIEEGFLLSAHGAYENREFLASTDERFRPVSLASGPDGALYITDMYRGIIQHGPYMTPYLREVSLKRKLDKPIHMGRIWRISAKEGRKVDVPNLEGLQGKDLIPLLEHPNGWTRDMAQRLLVEQEDLSVVANLHEMVLEGNPLGQLHALWTLEGLKHRNPEIYLQALESKNAKVAQATLRIVQQLIQEEPTIATDVEKFIDSNYEGSDPTVQMQMILASGMISEEKAFSCSQKFLEVYGHLPVGRDVVLGSLENRESSFLNKLLSQSEWKTYDQSHEIFVEQLTTAISNKGNVSEMNELLELLAAKEDTSPVWLKSAVANGILTSRRSANASPIILAEEPEVFKDFNNNDENITLLMSDLQKHFSWPGKPSPPKNEETTTYEIDGQQYAEGRQNFLNLCASCHGTQGEGVTRFAPPLQGSEWVNGDENKLVMIMLQGMEGPVEVKGKIYDIPDILPNMPAFSTLQDREVAAIATYIRNAWGNSQSAVAPRTVGGIRFRTQGKITPWKASDLDSLVFDIDL